MTDLNQIEETTQLYELTDEALNDVSGGNIILGILAGIYGNAVYDSLKGRSNGVFVQYHDQMLKYFAK